MFKNRDKFQTLKNYWKRKALSAYKDKRYFQVPRLKKNIFLYKNEVNGVKILFRVIKLVIFFYHIGSFTYNRSNVHVHLLNLYPQLLYFFPRGLTIYGINCKRPTWTCVVLHEMKNK